MTYEFDIFVGGPKPKYASVDYVTAIRDAFPEKKLFCPFERPTQENAAWKKDNLYGLRNSRAFFGFMPTFPFPGLAFESGYFYNCHQKVELHGEPLEEIVVVVPDSVAYPNGNSVFDAYGQFFMHTAETKPTQEQKTILVQRGIERLQQYFSSLK